MSTPSPLDEGLSPERLTETLRRAGGLDGGRVVDVAVETSRLTLVSIITGTPIAADASSAGCWSGIMPRSSLAA